MSGRAFLYDARDTRHATVHRPERLRVSDDEKRICTKPLTRRTLRVLVPGRLC
jgi:hypothetical protein